MQDLAELSKDLKAKIEKSGERPAKIFTVPQAPSLCARDCPVCGGVGYVSSGIEDTNDPRFGKLLLCPCVDGRKVYGSASGLVESEFYLTWDSIIDRENVSEAVKAVQDTLARGWGWVFLYGACGLAKTLIEKVVVAQVISAAKPRPAAYCTMSDMISNLREAYDTDNPSVQAELRLSHWSGIDVLCLDEVDRIKGTEFATEKRFTIMDRRYESASREKSITIMAANSDPTGFEGSWSDRIFDGRFSVIRLTGASMRPMMGR